MKLQNISQGKAVFVQFCKNFKGPPFYSGRFPQKNNNLEVIKFYKNF